VSLRWERATRRTAEWRCHHHVEWGGGAVVWDVVWTDGTEGDSSCDGLERQRGKRR